MIKEGKSKIISTAFLSAAISFAGCGEKNNLGGVGSHDANNKTSFGRIYENVSSIENEVAMEQKRNSKNAEVLSEVVQVVGKSNTNYIFRSSRVEVRKGFFAVFMDFEDIKFSFEIPLQGDVITPAKAESLILSGLDGLNSDIIRK